MAISVTITLTTPGGDTGPFDLYSNADGYVSAFETGVSKSSLTSGYLSTLVPDGSTIVRVKSTGTCTNYIDITISGAPTTTTSTTTTTTTAPPVIIPVSYNLSGSGTTSLKELKFYKNGVLIQTVNSDGTGSINYSDTDTIRVTLQINGSIGPFGSVQTLDIYDQTFNLVYSNLDSWNAIIDSGNIPINTLGIVTSLDVYASYYQ
jgi:hypothetical protein